MNFDNAAGKHLDHVGYVNFGLSRVVETDDQYRRRIKEFVSGAGRSTLLTLAAQPHCAVAAAIGGARECVERAKVRGWRRLLFWRKPPLIRFVEVAVVTPMDLNDAEREAVTHAVMAASIVGVEVRIAWYRCR